MSLPAPASTESSSQDAWASICGHLTQAGTIPVDVAVASLTPFERELLRMVRLAERPTVGAREQVLVCATAHRVALRLGSEPPPGEDLLEAIPLSAREREDAERLRASIEHRIDLFHRHEIIPALRARGASIGTLLLELRRTLPRLAPFVAFVGDAIYSAEGRWGDNLTTRDDDNNVFARLAGTNWRQWSAADQQFVFALIVLLESGGPYRLEGMNWSQLDPLTVDAYLRGKLREMTAVSVGGDDLSAPGLLRLAARVREHEGLVRSDFRLYRVINGATLNKQIKCLPVSKTVPPGLPSPLMAAFAARFEIDRADYASDRSYLRAVARRAHAEDGIEDAMLAVVWSGLRATGSDFFMSRGPRTLGLRENYRSLAKHDFYCVVVSRRGYDPAQHGLERYTAAQMRWNHSMRMQFNGWKFWYGSLDASERAPNQYFFVPPKMPDLAACEDAIHKGHRENGVVHSIRSPGALRLWGRTDTPRLFVGAMDVRAARTRADAPYGEAELLQTIWHQEWMLIVVQELAICGRRRGQATEIRGFDREHLQREDLVPRWLEEAFDPGCALVTEVAR